MRKPFKDVHVYFPPKVLADLKRLAKQNRRSVTAETVIAVERHVEQMREFEVKRQDAAKTIQHRTSLL